MYTDKQIRLFCEIGLVKHLKDMVHNYHKNSRFGGFLTKLEKECIKIQTHSLPEPSEFDLRAAGVKLERFGRLVKWTERKLSPNFMFCFNTRLLDESKHLRSEKLKKIMNDLLTYQEDRGYIKSDHYTEGDAAYTAWLSIWKEVDIDEHDSKKSQEIIDNTDKEITRKAYFDEYIERHYEKKNS